MQVKNPSLFIAIIFSMLLSIVLCAPIYADECTTGVASGAATPDGRPLLWKTRDNNAAQEFHYNDSGAIPFISVTYAEDLDDYYGGINAAGFALENSDSYDLGAGVAING